MEKWSRPNPPRLSDTEALSSKPLRTNTLLLRGSGWSGGLETPYTAENTFRRNPGHFRANGASPDANGKGSLSDACKEIPKGC